MRRLGRNVNPALLSRFRVRYARTRRSRAARRRREARSGCTLGAGSRARHRAGSLQGGNERAVPPCLDRSHTDPVCGDVGAARRRSTVFGSRRIPVYSQIELNLSTSTNPLVREHHIPAWDAALHAALAEERSPLRLAGYCFSRGHPCWISACSRVISKASPTITLPTASSTARTVGPSSEGLKPSGADAVRTGETPSFSTRH